MKRAEGPAQLKVQKIMPEDQVRKAVTTTYTPGTAGTPEFSVRRANISFVVGDATFTRPSVLGWEIKAGRNDGVITASVISSDMTAVAQLGKILTTLQKDGALLGFKLGDTRGDTIYVVGQIPREELEAYLAVRRAVREGMEGQPYEVELSLDTDAISD